MLFFSSSACLMSPLLQSRCFEYKSRSTYSSILPSLLVGSFFPLNPKFLSLCFFPWCVKRKLYSLIITSVTAKLDSGLNGSKHSLNVIFQYNIVIESIVPSRNIGCLWVLSTSDYRLLRTLVHSSFYLLPWLPIFSSCFSVFLSSCFLEGSKVGQPLVSLHPLFLTL